MNPLLHNRIAEQWVQASSHRKSVALMRFLSGVARRLGVGDHVYVVGGAVRNWVIDQPIKDIDVMIDSVALKGRDSGWFADQLQKAIPAKTNWTTNQYGVAILTVKSGWVVDGEDLNGEIIEIANARKESYGGAGGKGYKPHMVEPSTVEEDVVRREFTFNTLMWRLSELASGPDKAEIVDITGCGLDDLKAGVMKCPSNPDKTFSDDPTRMIRAVKFLTKYGFKIDGDVRKSIQRNAQKIKNVPQNAVAKLLMEDVLKEKTGVKAVVEMLDLGLLDPLADMIADDKAFRATLVNWSREKPLRFIYNIIDVGFPLEVPLGFLPRKDHQRRFRELVFLLSPEEGQDLYEALRQPGKAWKDKKFLRDLAVEHEVSGKGMGPFAQAVQIVARDLLLAEPDLLQAPRALRDRIERELSGEWSSKQAAADYKGKMEVETNQAELAGRVASQWVSEYGGATDYIDLAIERLATKSQTEKEDEAIESLVKPAPKKKPPRYDLRNRRRTPEGDKDMEGDSGNDKDRDLSMNYKRVAMAIIIASEFSDGSPTEKGAKNLWKRYKKKHPDTTKKWDDFYNPRDEDHKEPEEEKEDNFDAEEDKKRREEEQDRAVRKLFDTAMDSLGSLRGGFKEQVEVLTEGMSESDLQEVRKTYFSQREKLIKSSDEWSEKEINDLRKSMTDFPEKGADPKEIGEHVAKALYAKKVVFNPERSGGKAIDNADMSPSELRFRAEASFQNWKGMNSDERATAASDLRKIIAKNGEDSPEGKQASALLDGVKLAALMAGDRNEEGLIPAYGDEPEPSYKFQMMAKALAGLPEGREILFSSVEEMSKPGSGTRAVMQRALSSLDDDSFIQAMGGGPNVPEEQKGRLVKQFESGDLSGRDKDRLRQLMVNMALDDMMLLHFAARDELDDEEEGEGRDKKKDPSKDSEKETGDGSDEGSEDSKQKKPPTSEEVDERIRQRENKSRELDNLYDEYLDSVSDAERDRIDKEIRLERMKLLEEDCARGDSASCAILTSIIQGGDPNSTDLKTDPPLR